MIDLQYLEGVNKEEVIALLKKEGTVNFEIFIPKYSVQFFSTSENIAIDYLKWAYAGQLLHDISEKFSYEEISPDKHESALFELETTNIDELAETLLEISSGYENDLEDDDYSFEEGASNYIDEVNEKIITDIACPYFIEVYNEFMAEAAAQEMEEDEE